MRTAVQVVRSWWLGGYTVSVVAGRLRILGPQPQSPDLEQAVRNRRDELLGLLETFTGGTWPPAPGAVIRGNEEAALFMLEVPGQVAEHPTSRRAEREEAA